MNLVTFVQDEMGAKAGHAAKLDDPTVSYTDDGDYKEFFSRPIKIQDITWAEGATISMRFSPWANYFLKQQVANKLRGFARIRANLHLRFVVNGSPFRYGDLLVSYRPLFTNYTGLNAEFPFYSGGSIAGDNSVSNYPSGSVPGNWTNEDSTIMARSQRPHIHIYPQTNSGGDMILPFIYPKDAIRIDTLSAGSHGEAAFSELGTIMIDTIIPLLTTASPNTNPVTISVFAWAESIMLYGPTGVAINGGPDEFDSKMSTKASAIAEAVGDLSSVPVIGPYATATSTVLGAAASTMKLFGLTNPPDISTRHTTIPKTSFMNPSPTISEAYDVLALDPKNQTTIDPGVGGCVTEDELTIESICSRPAYIGNIQWNNSDTSTTVLGFFPVTPSYCISKWITNTANPSVNCAKLSFTPASYIAQMFKFWRGTMRLHLKVICSNFHRGRLCVSWDPNEAITDISGARICKILDLATADEVTVDVPFMNDYGMCGVWNYPSTQITTSSTAASFTSWGNRTATSTIYPGAYLGNMPYHSNGNILLTVLTGLQAGDTTANAFIVAHVSFHNMEFAVPIVDATSAPINPVTITSMAMKNLVLNGGEEPTGQSASEIVEGSYDNSQIPLLYSGEKIVSLRSLFHRSYFYRAINYTTATARNLITASWARFPVPRHTRLPIVYDSMTGTLGGAFGTNFCATTPIALITGCCVGYRGGLVWNVANTEGYTGKGCYSAFLHRAAASFTSGLSVIDMSTLSATKSNSYIAATLGSLLNGGTYSTQSNSGVVSASFPMYTNLRFFPGNMQLPYPTTQVATMPAFDPAGESWENDYVRYVGFSNAAGNSNLLLSVSAAHDFAPIGFLNCPDLYMANSYSIA